MPDLDAPLPPSPLRLLGRGLQLLVAVLRLIGQTGGRRRAATVVQWVLVGLTVLYFLLADRGAR